MKILYKLSLILLLTFLSIGFSGIATSCNTTEPQPQKDNGTLTLSLTETSCTEAWVNLKTNGVTFPVNVNLLQDNTVAQAISLSKADTTIYIDSLLPNKTYNIQAVIQSTNQYQATTSNKLTVQTLDTTSNNFTWQTYTFGAANAGSSSLNDVAIIDENNIWAVGEIYMDDSTGNTDPQPYAIAHWDGINWKLQKVYYITSSGFKQIISNIRGILYSSSDDIWFAAGSIFHWDGKSDTTQLIYSRLNLSDPNATIEKLWGNSSLIYGVGNAGTIVFYNGSTWQKIESGTTTDINDIWGYYNQATNNLSVLAVASNIHFQGDYRLLSVLGSSAKDTLNWPYNNSLSGLWFQGKYTPVYICGSGIKEYQQGGWKQLNLPNYFTESIRGNAINDIIAVGDFGFITHFNGSSWRSINLSNNYVFYSVAIKNNTVAIAGVSTSGVVVGGAIIIIGKR